MPSPSIIISVIDGILMARIDHPQLNEDIARDMVDDIAAAADRQPDMPVLLDLSKVSFLPSMAIGALVTLLKKLQEGKHRLMISGAQTPVRTTLAMCRVDKLFQFADTENDARARLRPAP
jgi:anti-anti-sigma factor